MNIIKRFWKYVDKQGPNECWEWIGCKDNNGYGQLGIKGKKQGAHRISWAIAHKTWPIPIGKQINHTCDNESCVNPAHLYLGTQQDNMRDKSALTLEDVREIRKFRTEGYKLRELEIMYGYTTQFIGQICSYKRWKNV